MHVLVAQALRKDQGHAFFSENQASFLSLTTAEQKLIHTPVLPMSKRTREMLLDAPSSTQRAAFKNEQCFKSSITQDEMKHVIHFLWVCTSS